MGGGIGKRCRTSETVRNVMPRELFFKLVRWPEVCFLAAWRARGLLRQVFFHQCRDLSHVGLAGKFGFECPHQFSHVG